MRLQIIQSVNSKRLNFNRTLLIIYVKSNDSPEIATMKKVVQNEITNLSVYAQGKALYNTYCVACHMPDKNGDESGNPSLVAIGTRMSREDALNKVKRGGGKMPSFASVIAGKEEAIISYLSGAPGIWLSGILPSVTVHSNSPVFKLIA